MSEQGAKWLQQVSEFVSSLGTRGGAVLVLSEYRPDVAKAVAHRLGLRFYDFRAEVMAPKGILAGSVDLDILDSVLTRLAVEGGAVVLNVEALLVTRDAKKRRTWIQSFVRKDWANLLLVPMTLFGQEAAQVTERVLLIPPEDLPPQSLVSRLLN